MKKNLQFIMLLATCAAFFGGATVNFAQTNPPAVGGYKTVSVNDPAVKEAAVFAIDEYSLNNDSYLQILAVSRAERQIVQGTNYRMCIEFRVEDEENNADTYFVLAVVHQNLEKAYTLKSWEADGCRGDDKE